MLNSLNRTFAQMTKTFNTQDNPSDKPGTQRHKKHRQNASTSKNREMVKNEERSGGHTTGAVKCCTIAVFRLIDRTVHYLFRDLYVR